MKNLNKYIVLFVLSSLIIAMFIGCTKKDSQDTFDIEQFTSEMKAKNYNFEIQDVENPDDFLSNTKKRMVIGKEALDIYLYNSNKEMEDDAKNINMNGFGYSDGNKSIIVDWISYPHFYKKGNIIVLYVGENEKIISDLNDIMGEQFAGDK
jgi:hypothetical protein